MAKYKKVFRVLRWVLSILALVLVGRQINFDGLFLLFSSIKFYFVIIALALSVVIRILVSLRLSLLLQTQGHKVSTFRLLKMTVVSDAMGFFLPSLISREGIKAFLVWKYIGKAVDTVTSVVVDRFTGLFALTGIALFCGLISFEAVNSLDFVILSGAIFGVCVLTYVIMFILQNSRIAAIFFRIKIPYMQKVSSKISMTLETFAKFGRHKGVMVKTQLLSIVVQLLRISYIFCMTLALGTSVPFLHLAVFLPIIFLLLMLPISIGGIGVQETAYIYFFTPLGMLVEEAVGISLLCYTAFIFWLLIGWFVYAREGLASSKDMLDAKKTGNGYVF